MFFGQFDHNLDDKGRLTIPSLYRDLLAERAYITQGFDDNLMVMQAEEFDSLYHKIKTMSITDSHARDLARMLFGNAVPLEMDKAGRILIPPFLREAAHLTTSVKLIGLGPYFELWSAEDWDAKAAIMNDGAERADRFKDLDLTF
ncbi:MAG: transcriptional regulator MraZ [Chloroflexota bacterium]|nr:transcriptional regulator MraZ [Chloroflexota bacterium]